LNVDAAVIASAAKQPRRQGARTAGLLRCARNDRGWWCALVVLCVVLLAPLTIADVPPLLDYPNHLARLYVLSMLPGDPVLARFYETRWGIIPNLGLDLTVPPLLRIFPVHLVGRAVVAVALLLPVFGAVAYHRALTARLSYWPLCSVMFVYNAALLRGFLNFIISVGLALLLAAAWLAWRDRWPVRAVLTCALGAVALFFCHLTGLLFFAVLISGHELLILRTDPLETNLVLHRIVAVAAVFAAPVALYALSHLGQMEGDATFRSVTGKAQAALIPVINYLWPLDLVTAVLCVAIPALCLARRWCVMPLRAVAALVVLLLLFAALPTAFKGTYDLDTRFIIMAAFVIPAAISPLATPCRINRAIAVGFVLLFGVRMIVLMTVWHSWAGELAAFRAVTASVAPGDIVMTVQLRRAERESIWTATASPGRLSDGTTVDGHLPALLLIEHRAWWPFLFDNLSQQPIKTREPFRTAANLVDNSPDPISLLAGDAPAMRLFTHVLVFRGSDSARIEAPWLRSVASNEEAALNAVLRDGINQPPPIAPPTDR
jgi:hypothetical protein